MKNSTAKFASILFPYPPLQCFTYEVPARIQDDVEIGHQVLVPLGRRKAAGIVVDFLKQPPIYELREIEDIMDPVPLLSPELLALTQWIARYYLASWGEVVRTALPPGIHQKTQLMLEPGQSQNPGESLTELQMEIIDTVQNRGRISLQSLERKLGQKYLRFQIGKLEKTGLIIARPSLKEPPAQVKYEKQIILSCFPETETMQNLKRKAPRQAQVLETLAKKGEPLFRRELNVSLAVLDRLSQSGYIQIRNVEVFRDPYPEMPVPPGQTFQLTREQEKALSEFNTAIQMNRFETFLLHGVTASGKTQVYIEAIRKTLKLGRTALVLVPEISLTPQAVQRYRSAFGDKVAVLHSRMSMGERYDSWRKIRDGSFRIALGPRSAVFAPLQNPGLIVVDEEQDASYKQMDPSPRYHARDVAVMRGKISGSVVILGSATPSLESYYNARTGKYTLCQLTHRIDRTPMPKITIVNQKDDDSPEHRVFFPLLREHLENNFKLGLQTILLQNRRGYAPYLRCISCGAIEKCPHCDISLTFHQNQHLLKCHYCGFQKKTTDICPDCGGTSISYRGVGTQRVEEELKTHFPQLRILRMDQDTTKRKGEHDRIVWQFEKGEYDVLLGTQMVAKGHDFPGVNLVGIISADTGIHFPDFRAGEKTFQLLTQAAGRAGRRNLRGEVIIQTRSPDHPVLQFVIGQDYAGFYQWESEQRKELNYPPWGRLVLVRFAGEKEEAVSRAAMAFPEMMPRSAAYAGLGPVVSPISRLKKQYRHQMIFKGNKKIDPSGIQLKDNLMAAINRMRKNIQYRNVRIIVDVDPLDVL